MEEDVILHLLEQVKKAAEKSSNLGAIYKFVNGKVINRDNITELARTIDPTDNNGWVNDINQVYRNGYLSDDLDIVMRKIVYSVSKNSSKANDKSFSYEEQDTEHNGYSKPIDKTDQFIDPIDPVAKQNVSNAGLSTKS